MFLFLKRNLQSKRKLFFQFLRRYVVGTHSKHLQYFLVEKYALFMALWYVKIEALQERIYYFRESLMRERKNSNPSKLTLVNKWPRQHQVRHAHFIPNNHYLLPIPVLQSTLVISAFLISNNCLSRKSCPCFKI